MFSAEGHARLVDSERGLGETTPARGFSPGRDGSAVKIEPGKEEDFRYLRDWLTSSAWLDRLIAATEAETAARKNQFRRIRTLGAGRAAPTAARRVLEWDSAPAPVGIGRS